MKNKIGIIGFGNMGGAIGERLKSRYQILVFDKDGNKTKQLPKGLSKDSLSIKVANDLKDLVDKADTLILAVKPQDFQALLNEIKHDLKGQLVISIAAGITTEYIEKILGKIKVIRVMPNMPAKVGQGMSCLCRGKYAKQEDLSFAVKMFNYLGETLILKEDMMHAATAISGSGPGFYYDLIQNKPKNEWEDYGNNVFIPRFSSAAEMLGFGKKDANKLASVVTSGSLVTVEATGETPAHLKEQITSKGGTTEAGLEALHRTGSLIEAAKAALKRARELSRR